MSFAARRTVPMTGPNGPPAPVRSTLPAADGVADHEAQEVQ